MIVYASSDDLTAWLGTTAPANADRLLRAASTLITEFIACDIYRVDDNGLPLDPVLLQATNDATCAQAETWITLGIDPAGGSAGAGRVLTSSKIGTGSVAYTTAKTTAEDRATAASQLSPRSKAILQEVRAGSGQPIQW